MFLLIFVLHAAAFAKTDYSRCNDGGLIGDARHYRITPSGSLQYDKSGENTLLISSKFGRTRDELAFYEYSGKEQRGLRVGQGFGSEGVLRVQARLNKKEGHPFSLETSYLWFPLEGASGWAKVKAGLRAKTRKLVKSERTRETQSWVTYSYSGERCYVAQEGVTFHSSKLVTFDQALCNRVLRITDAAPDTLLKEFRGEDAAAKKNAARVFRLIRDAQIATDEKLRMSGRRLQAVELTPPEHQFPGTMPAEDSSALQELRSCVAAQTRNGLERPEASPLNTDFMGDEPDPDLAE